MVRKKMVYNRRDFSVLVRDRRHALPLIRALRAAIPEVVVATLGRVVQVGVPDQRYDTVIEGIAKAVGAEVESRGYDLTNLDPANDPTLHFDADANVFVGIGPNAGRKCCLCSVGTSFHPEPVLGLQSLFCVACWDGRDAATNGLKVRRRAGRQPKARS